MTSSSDDVVPEWAGDEEPLAHGEEMDLTDDYNVYRKERMTELKQHRWLGHKKRWIDPNTVVDVNPFTNQYIARPMTQEERDRLREPRYQPEVKQRDPDDSNEAIETSSSSSTSSSLLSSYWYDAWEPVIENYVARHTEWKKSKLIRTRMTVARDKLRDINVALGDKRLAMIHKTLGSYGSTRRAPHQRMFHDKFIISALPHIYGQEWEWSQERVLRKHGITKIDHEVSCTLKHNIQCIFTNLNRWKLRVLTFPTK